MTRLAQRTAQSAHPDVGRAVADRGLIESGRLAAAVEGLDDLGSPRPGRRTGQRVAPRSGHGCLAQAQGRYADAAALARRGFERMRPIERPPASGPTSHCTPRWPATWRPRRGRAVAREPFDPPPRFRVIYRLTRALLLLRAGRTRPGRSVGPPGRPGRDLVAAGVLRTARPSLSSPSSSGATHRPLRRSSGTALDHNVVIQCDSRMLSSGRGRVPAGIIPCDIWLAKNFPLVWARISRRCAGATSTTCGRLRHCE